MDDAPCGCEQFDDAQHTDGHEREFLLDKCATNAEHWRCPRARVEPGPLGGKAGVIARELEALTGCARDSITTCPRHLAGSTDVVRALRLYRAQQGGGVTFDDDPPASIVAASEVIGGADAKRLDAEQADREKNRGR